MNSSKDELERNYRNFGIAILAILVVFIILGSIGHFLDFPKTHEPSIAYNSGVKTGRFIRWYIDSGLWFGNLFAFFAALEKRYPLGKGILISLLGWVYVIYYSITRKKITQTS